MFRIPGMMALCFFTITSVYGADRQDAKENDSPPYSFRLHSQSGNETFQADCTQDARDTATCHFLGARINAGAVQKDTDSLDSTFRNLPPNERQNMLDDFSRDSAERQKMIDTLQEQLKDSTIGPKKKDTIRELLNAYRTGDYPKSMEVMAIKEKRTCSVDTQSFSLDFKRIGRWKWVSNPGPGGLCNFVKVYELLGEPLRGDSGEILSVQWRMTETRVVADIKRPICEGADKELNKTIVWSWRYPNEYELSCDFLTFKSFSQH